MGEFIAGMRRAAARSGNQGEVSSVSGSVVTAGRRLLRHTRAGSRPRTRAPAGSCGSSSRLRRRGAPISFRGPDGQYVAIYAGIGGDWLLLSGDVRSDDPADVRPPPILRGAGAAHEPGRHCLDSALSCSHYCACDRPRGRIPPSIRYPITFRWRQLAAGGDLKSFAPTRPTSRTVQISAR